MTSKQSLTLTIAGQRINVRTDHDEARLLQLTEYVEEAITKLQGSSRHASPQVLLLTLLQVANELFIAQEEAEGLKVSVQKRLERIVSMLDSAGANAS